LSELPIASRVEVEVDYPNHAAVSTTYFERRLGPWHVARNGDRWAQVAQLLSYVLLRRDQQEYQRVDWYVASLSEGLSWVRALHVLSRLLSVTGYCEDLESTLACSLESCLSQVTFDLSL
jgi:hypothetical protein